MEKTYTEGHYARGMTQQEYSSWWQKQNRDSINTRRRVWREQNKEREIDVRRMLMFNSTKEQLLEIFNKQNKTCAICETPLDFYGTETHIDHNHFCCPTRKSCGKCVRGFLCRKHNNGIGFFNEDIEIFKKVIKYLGEPSNVI